MNMKYINNEPLTNIGMYFRPALMWPFSIIDTISAEKNATTSVATQLNVSKYAGLIAPFLKSNGMLMLEIPASASLSVNCAM